MEKLKPKFDEIWMATFAAGAAEPLPRGTVEAHLGPRTRYPIGCCPATSQLQCSVTGICA